MIPVSIATIDELKQRDFHVARIIEEYEIDVEMYFDLSSEYILRVMEYDWWRPYAAAKGISSTKIDSKGNTVTSFNPLRIVKTHAEVVNIHCFYTLHLIYRALSTQLSTPFETAQRNTKFWQEEFERASNRMFKVSDFYDVDMDGVIEFNEQRLSPYESQRLGNRYIR
jgi:hypothetical protein